MNSNKLPYLFIIDFGSILPGRGRVAGTRDNSAINRAGAEGAVLSRQMLAQTPLLAPLALFIKETERRDDASTAH
jgi:hypothetical protein